MALRWSAGLLSFDSLLPCRMANHLLPLDAALRMLSVGAAHRSHAISHLCVMRGASNARPGHPEVLAKGDA